MNIALWSVQGLLALVFLMAGMMKLSKSREEMKRSVGPWVDSVSDRQFKTIGLLETLGAVGLVLPMLLKTLPVLAPKAIKQC